MPTGFFPAEDQGGLFTPITLPVGAMQSRTLDVAKQVEHFYLVDEKDNVHTIFIVAGFSFAGQGQNTGQAFVNLTDWDERPGEANSAQAIVGRAFKTFSKIRDAQIFPLLPSPVRELGNSTGFEMELEDRGDLGHAALMAARDQLLAAARKSPLLAQVRQNGLDDTPQLHLEVDQAKANALGISVADINATLSAAWGGSYINDFIDRGRVKRVYMQGDAPFRMMPEDLERWYVRSATGTMAPFSSFMNWQWKQGPARLERYNGRPVAQHSRAKVHPASAPAPRWTKWNGSSPSCRRASVSNGPARRIRNASPGAQAPALYTISLLVVFLCLAALYESWAVPVAVMLVVPLGIIGAVLAATLRGLVQRHLLPGGPARHDGTRGEERDPDRRIRRGGTAQRGGCLSKRRCTPRGCDCGRS